MKQFRLRWGERDGKDDVQPEEEEEQRLEECDGRDSVPGVNTTRTVCI